MLPGILLTPWPTHAQEAGVENVVVVTARLRPERLLDVPLAVDVTAGEDMRARDIHTIEDLSASIPALAFRANASAKDRTIHIRGIGTTTTSAAAEPSVSTVLDGVVLVRGGQQTIEIGDIERVEVLRGPQGTLFGKNASAGVINITTAEPSAQAAMRLAANLSGDGEERLEFAAGGPFRADGPDYRLAGLWARFAGNVRNVLTGEMLNGHERLGGRAKLSHELAPALHLTVAADYLEERDDAPYGIYADSARTMSAEAGPVANPALATALASEGIAPSRTNTRIAAVEPTRVVNRNGGLAINAAWLVERHEITSVTAWRSWRNRQVLDLDGRAGVYPGLPGTRDDGHLAFAQFSQEVRIASPPENPLQFVAGAFFLSTQTDETYRRAVSVLLPDGSGAGATGVAAFDVETYGTSVFGEASLHISAPLTLTAGMRLVRDVVRYDHRRLSSLQTDAPGIRTDQASSGRTAALDVSGRVGASWQFAADANLYATVSRGYKGPGFNVFFNMGPLDSAPLAPERSSSYEIGLKGAPGSLLTFSLAAFLTRFSGYQASILQMIEGTPTLNLVNAGDISSRGIEADLTLRSADRASVELSLAWTDAKVDAFRCPAGAIDCPAAALDGARLPYAPKLKLWGQASYDLPITARQKLTLAADATFTSRTRYQLYSTPDTIQPAFTLLNASVTMRNLPTSTSLRLLAHNILDQNYSTYLAGASGGGLLRMVPRGAQRRLVLMLMQDF